MGYDELTLAQKALYDASTVHHTDCGPMLLLGFDRARQTVPHAAFMDDDWRPVSRLLLKFYANRLAAENQPGRARGEPGLVSSTTAPNSLSGSRSQRVKSDTPVPQVRATAQKVPITGVEARIRELTGVKLMHVAQQNGVKVEIHPTNGGLTQMRRKNALLALLRRGVQVKL